MICCSLFPAASWPKPRSLLAWFQVAKARGKGGEGREMRRTDSWTPPGAITRPPLVARTAARRQDPAWKFVHELGNQCVDVDARWFGAFWLGSCSKHAGLPLTPAGGLYRPAGVFRVEGPRWESRSRPLRRHGWSACAGAGARRVRRGASPTPRNSSSQRWRSWRQWTRRA